MTRSLLSASLSTFLLITAATVLPAQDQFGRSVAIQDGVVFVLKPSAGRGPATVFTYARGAGGWEMSQRLTSAAAAETGERFSPSMAVAGEMLLVASGDANARWGGQAFRRDAAGAWSEVGRIPLGDAGGDSPESAAEAMSLGTVMRILRPPARIVALENDVAVVSAVTGNAATATVRLFERDGDEWVEHTRLASGLAEPRDQFGAALATDGRTVVAGAPRHRPAGATFVFVKSANTGEWTEQVMLTPEGLPSGSGFGSTVAFEGETILIGAPGNRSSAGVVIAYARDTDAGGWLERGRIVPGTSVEGDQFGAAIAVAGNELWIGAPGADARRGRIDRFVRDDAAGEWRAAEPLRVPDLDERFTLGRSIALGDDLAVAGAPGADGGMGRVAVFTRTESGDGAWSGADWISPGGVLEGVVGEEVRCADGRAAGFDCRDVDLLSYMPIDALGGGSGERVSDIWGWTDPETRREYALVGRTGGLVIVDITEPQTPVLLGTLPANPSGARDIKVYQDHVFFTGDGAGHHGLIVFDLTRLRDAGVGPVTFEADAKYEGIASAHNLVINTSSGFAFPVGASGGGETCGGGLHMVDIRDPKNPTFAGCFTDTEGLIYKGRTHDAQCVVYDGPDDEHRGREICFASNETALRIVDVTDKENPVPVSKGTYPGLSYVHQGWLTEDQRYFYLDDELDELVGQASRTRTIVWDVADLDDPMFVGEVMGATAATDHNLYVKGDRMYQANYQAGLRVYDISDPERPVEIGYFDTTPYEGNPPGMNGAWTAFPFFESGTVIVSSMHEGLFVLKPRPALVP